MKRAYSLIRFSSWKQAKGQSHRRQAEWSAAWCETNGCLLDESLHWDKPVSAFRGANRSKGALAAFLEMIQVGRVAKGSILLVESLDRLSREELDEALTLFFGILKAGIDIVTMVPERRYTKAAVGDIVGLLEPLVIMSRAHEESAIKSERILDVWEKRREKVREKPMNAVGPAWLRMESGHWKPIKERVAIVRSIFNLAIQGNGLHAIASQLNRSKTPVMARSKEWAVSSVWKILRNRALLGEFQPHVFRDGKRSPTGKVVPDYYPAIIDEETFYQVQSALEARKKQRGPRGKHVRNLFTGLLRDARDGCSMVVVTESDKCKSVRLVSSGAQRGRNGSDYRTFPYDVAEAAILEQLKELKASDVLPQTNGDGVDEVAHLSGRLQDLDHRISKVMNEMKGDGDFDLGLRLLRDMEAEKKDVVARLDKARAEAATNEVEVLGETQSLIDLVAGVEGEERLALRTKIKARLAQLISEMRMLIVPKRSKRVAALQVSFRGSNKRRDYLIYHSSGSHHVKGSWRARSMTSADYAVFGFVGTDSEDCDYGITMFGSLTAEGGLTAADNTRHTEEYLNSLDDEALEVIFADCPIHPL